MDPKRIPSSLAFTKPGAGPGAGAVLYDGGDDPYPSLSGFHDYEPQLEFDDAELLERKPEEEGGEDEEAGEERVPGALVPGQLVSPMADGTIDADFSLAITREAALAGQLGSPVTPVVGSREGAGTETIADYEDIAAHGIVEVVGDDKAGRKIIVVSACKLPKNKNFDYQRFLKYLMVALDQYVEMDYSIVYFHHGLCSANKPPLSWLWGLYKVLDRRFKKNLKSCYIVHPTSLIRVIYNFFKPIISAKFGRKIQYVNHLEELSPFMNIKNIKIPEMVRDYDNKTKLSSAASASNLTLASWHPQQQVIPGLCIVTPLPLA